MVLKGVHLSIMKMFIFSVEYMVYTRHNASTDSFR